MEKKRCFLTLSLTCEKKKGILFKNPKCSISNYILKLEKKKDSLGKITLVSFSLFDFHLSLQKVQQGQSLVSHFYPDMGLATLLLLHVFFTE